MRNAFTSRVWMGAATLGLAATVSLIAAQAPQPPAGGRGGQQPPPPAGGGRSRGGVMGAGPADAPYVDASLADRGRTVWAAECINCHGTQARGTDNGPNLTRSLVVLRDRYGSELGPFLKRGHKMQSGAAATTLTDEQIVNLAHFLRQRVNDSFRGSPHLPGPERPDRRREGGRRVLQWRREMRHLPFGGQEQSRGHWRASGADRSAATVPVSRRARGARPGGRSSAARARSR